MRRTSVSAVWIILGFACSAFLMRSLGAQPRAATLTRATIIGTLNSEMGRLVASRLRPVEDGSAEAVIVGAGKWSDDHRATMRRQYLAKHPVALIEPTAEQIADVRNVVGLKGTPQFPDGLTHLDAYAIDQASDGQQLELIVVPPADLPKASVASHTTNESTGEEIITTSGDEDAPYPAGFITRSAEVAEVMAWIDQDQERDIAVEARKEMRKDRASKEGVSDSAGAGKFNALEDVVTSTESRAVFTFRTNIHTLVTNVWSVHNATLNEDWFLVQQKGQFSASNELLPNALVNNISSQEGNDRGRFTEFYSVNTWVPFFVKTDVVWTEQSSPATTTGVEKVSSSVSWNLSGKLSGNTKVTSKGEGEVGFGAEITGGVSVNNSISFDIPDVTVRNQSGGMQNNAAWDYVISPPAWTGGMGCIGSWGLGPLKQMSAATFQPVQQWLWRVGPKARSMYPNGLPMTVRFRTRVRHMHYGAFCRLTDWKQNSEELASFLVAPWPK